MPHRHVSRHQTTMNSSLQGTQGKADGGGDSFGVFDLCKLSLRFRPDFVLVGEILGQEADACSRPPPPVLGACARSTRAMRSTPSPGWRPRPYHCQSRRPPC
ncbi:MAG: hypothetical protein J4F28_08135 [Nitrosopumilaceae archaeon]|nr:hypothetical protein [Nitrosopumilaceae archaeon]